MNIILFGPPGSGKGTQSNMLSKNYDLFKISTGDLLREEINKKSSLGLKIKNTVNSGNLVSDSIINDLIKGIMDQKKFFNRLIFDGYPRTLSQTTNLEIYLKKFDQSLSFVFSLKVKKDIIIKRILGRQICSKCGLTFNEFFYPENKSNHSCDLGFLKKRSDDKQTSIEARYETYVKQTMPIIDFYKGKNLLYEINGTKEIAGIYSEISTIISTLKG